MRVNEASCICCADWRAARACLSDVLRALRYLRSAHGHFLDLSGDRVRHCTLGLYRLSDGKRNIVDLRDHLAERLDRIAAIRHQAEDVFESREIAARWMSNPNKALGGGTPVMLCETEIGAKQVRHVLQALKGGGAA